MVEETSLVEVAPIVGIDQAEEPERADTKCEERKEVEVANANERDEHLMAWWSVPLVLFTCGPLNFLAGIVGGAIVSAVLLGLTCWLAHRVHLTDTRRGGEGARAETGQGEARERGTRKHNVRARHGQNQSQVQGDTAYKDRFAWAMVAIAVGLTVAGTAAAYVGKQNRWSSPFTELPIPLVAMLAWAVTLSRGCSPWPVFVIVMVIMPYATPIGWFMDTLSWGVGYQNHLKKLGLDTSFFGSIHASTQMFLFYSAGTHGTICLPFYLGLHAARDFLRHEYSDPVAAAGLPLRVGSEIAGALVPVVLYLSVQQYAAVVAEGAMNMQYAEHTPMCQKLPEGVFRDYGVPFVACDLWSEVQQGSALQPLYILREATPTPTFEYVWSRPYLVNQSWWWHASWPTSRRGTPPLSYNDTKRFEAVEKYEMEGPPVFSAARYQGNAAIFGMFSSQIFARVRRVSFLDAVRFSISYAEAIALLSTFFLLLLAFFTLGSNMGLYTRYDVYVNYFMAFILLVLLFSLWRIAVDAETIRDVDEEEEEEEEEEEGKKRREMGEQEELTEYQADRDFTKTSFHRPRRTSALTDTSFRVRGGGAETGVAVAVAAASSDVQQKVLETMVEALQREVNLARTEALESKQVAEAVQKENVDLKTEAAEAKEKHKTLQRMAAETKKEREQLREQASKLEREIAEMKASNAKDMVAILSRMKALEDKAASSSGSAAQEC